MSTNLPAAVSGLPVALIPFHLSSVTADATNAIRFRLPFEARLAGVSVCARAATGTNPTLTVNVKAGATSLLAAPVVVTTAAPSLASLAVNPVAADESVIGIDLDIGGTDSPAFADVTILLTLIRQV